MSNTISFIDSWRSFLAEVASHADKNNMDASNLATVFAPTVMRSRDSADPAKFLLDIGHSTGILNHLIRANLPSFQAKERLKSVGNVPSASASASSRCDDPFISCLDR